MGWWGRTEVKIRGVGVVATFDGVWHRDSHYWRRFVGGSTQDTDFYKGIIGFVFTNFLRQRNRGGQGHSDPLMQKHFAR